MPFTKSQVIAPYNDAINFNTQNPGLRGLMQPKNNSSSLLKKFNRIFRSKINLHCIKVYFASFFETWYPPIVILVWPPILLHQLFVLSIVFQIWSRIDLQLFFKPFLGGIFSRSKPRWCFLNLRCVFQQKYLSILFFNFHFA